MWSLNQKSLFSADYSDYFDYDQHSNSLLKKHIKHATTKSNAAHHPSMAWEPRAQTHRGVVLRRVFLCARQEALRQHLQTTLNLASFSFWSLTSDKPFSLCPRSSVKSTFARFRRKYFTRYLSRMNVKRKLSIVMDIPWYVFTPITQGFTVF